MIGLEAILTFIIGSGCVNPNESAVQGSALGGSEWGAVCAPVDQGRFRRSPPGFRRGSGCGKIGCTPQLPKDKGYPKESLLHSLPISGAGALVSGQAVGAVRSAMSGW
eukprot:scaffold6293_cov133-Isochrysis_galbana.AAC.1